MPLLCDDKVVGILKLYQVDRDYIDDYLLVQDLLDELIPVLIIQPLVENAVLHGVSACINGGEIVITCKEKKHNLYVLVRDNGKGIPKTSGLKY